MKKEMIMKKNTLMAIVVVSSVVLSAPAFAATSTGGEIFKANCSVCHPHGGNVMRPDKTLKGIRNPGKIITQVRSGGGGMPSFDAKTISDADAKQLAEYIMKTFKK